LTRRTAGRYAFALMSTEPPDLIDPWRAADTNVALSGRLPLSGLKRLAGLLADASGEAVFELRFYRDEAQRPVVRARVGASLLARCQRCLGSVVIPVDSCILLAAVTDPDAARQLPERYDPLLAEDRLVRLPELIEDELLLALPQIPRHAPGQCSTAIGQPASPRRENPFAVLAQWKGGEGS
jgi:uncharacterized protein